MSVVGIDFGTRNSVIAVLQGRKVDVIANEVSLRQTAGCVGFTFKQRELGEQGLDQFTRNARNTILGVKALLGRKLEDPALKPMLRSMGACKWVAGPNGNIAVEVQYKGETRTFTSEQLVAMLLTKLKTITEKATNVAMVACVVSVPGWWSSTQRVAFLNAAKIAALPVLRIVNDLSAIAFNYGFFHPTAFSTASHVMFLDMGYSSFGCCIAEMSAPQTKIVSQFYDTTTGGWEIDQLLADHFAAGFNKKNGANIQNDPRGWLKLLSLVEKAKKTLNMNDLAQVAMDCISDGCDISEKITREEYVQLLKQSGITEKVLAVIQKTLDRAGLKVADLHSVEWVGSTLRVTAIREAVQAFLGEKPLSAQMNAEEAVAIGSCLLCARHSPTASTRPYDLVESTRTAVTLAYTMGAKNQSFQLFSDDYALPKMKALNSTFPEAKPATLEMKYTDPSSVCLGNELIAVATIPEVPASSNPSKLRLKSKAEPFGIFGFVQADLIEEKEETVEVPIETPKPAEGDKMQVEEKPAEGAASPTAEGDKMQVEEKPKTRTETRKVNVETKLKLEVSTPGALTQKEVEAFTQQELDMRRQDAYVIATANAKNELETFAYFASAQRSGEWKEYGSKEEFDAIEELCGQTTTWLYGDGSDVTKEDYEDKMLAIKVLTEPVRLRLVAKQEAEKKAQAEKEAAEKAALEKAAAEKAAAEKAAAEKAAAEKAAAEKAAAEQEKPMDTEAPQTTN